jgi:4-hydroxy-tetrahydrodipicolinate reductase
LIGTTGFDGALGPVLDVAAGDIPLLVAPNTSLGVTLLLELVRAAAGSLGPDFDIEIIEAHHRMKKDAPSGTALALGRAAEEGRAAVEKREALAAQAGAGGSAGWADHPAAKPTVLTDRSGLRREGDIGYAVVRGGDVVGEHSVLFAGKGEQVTLGHRATDRDIFARGALRAALWLAGQHPGRYVMRDVLGGIPLAGTPVGR